MRRLLSHDPITGLDTWHEYDSQTDETHIITTGDAEPYLELNKARANDDGITKNGIKNGMWLYASIPPGIQVKWLVEHGVDIYKKEHGPQMSKLLEDPQYKYLKTTTRRHLFK